MLIVGGFEDVVTNNYVSCVRPTSDYISHNDHQSMLLYVPRARVQAPTETERGELTGRECPFKQFAKWQ